ncbi:hypothetical protein [Peribacillus sp. SCS-37]|uniref:hypothetical protein n=1 Tax=Paraperibacillus esterisolvens TaxID=3115296 RepID=UPI003905DFF8
MVKDYDEIKKLLRKSEVSREAHFMIANKLKFCSKVLHSIILIASSIVAILTFSSYESFTLLIPRLNEEAFKLGSGILASLTFILVVVEEYVDWGEASHKHENAGRQLTSLIREGGGLIKSESLSPAQVDSFRSKYIMLNESFPAIPNKFFLKSKQKNLTKIAISKELDKDPFLPIWLFKLKNKTKRRKQDINKEKGSD